MLKDELEKYKEFKNNLENEDRRMPVRINSAKARVSLEEDKLAEMDTESQDFIENARKIKDSSLKIGAMETKYRKLQERLKGFSTLPEVITMKQNIISEMDKELNELEEKKKAVEMKVKDLQEKAFDLTADYFSLQQEQGRTLGNVRQVLEMPSLDSKVSMNGLSARRLMALNDNQVDNEILKRFRNR